MHVREGVKEMQKPNSFKQVSRAVAVMGALLPAAVQSDERNQAYQADMVSVDKILEDYTERCLAARADAGLTSDESSVDNRQVLSLTTSSIYRMKIADKGTDSTVLYTDFDCEGVGQPWCGTGGCNAYIIVGGKTFEVEVTFPPYTIEIPNPYNASIRTAVLLPLHGTYCRTASQEYGYGSFGCYELALWDGDRRTFLTRTGLLSSVENKID